jgi:predicted transcriptional regulator of viral defense system
VNTRRFGHSRSVQLVASVSQTELHISQQYGAPLITLEDVAEILGRKPNSLRMLINQGRGDKVLGDKLRACRAHLGRRTMFRVSDIARLIDEA